MQARSTNRETERQRDRQSERERQREREIERVREREREKRKRERTTDGVDKVSAMLCLIVLHTCFDIAHMYCSLGNTKSGKAAMHNTLFDIDYKQTHMYNIVWDVCTNRCIDATRL